MSATNRHERKNTNATQTNAPIGRTYKITCFSRTINEIFNYHLINQGAVLYSQTEHFLELAFSELVMPASLFFVHVHIGKYF